MTDKLYRSVKNEGSMGEGSLHGPPCFYIRAEDAERYARLGEAYWNTIQVFGVDSEAIRTSRRHRDDETEYRDVWHELADALRAIEEHKNG